jgi:hypothetical protein
MLKTVLPSRNTGHGFSMGPKDRITVLTILMTTQSRANIFANKWDQRCDHQLMMHFQVPAKTGGTWAPKEPLNGNFTNTAREVAIGEVRVNRTEAKLVRNSLRNWFDSEPSFEQESMFSVSKQFRSSSSRDRIDQESILETHFSHFDQRESNTELKVNHRVDSVRSKCELILERNSD